MHPNKTLFRQKAKARKPLQVSVLAFCLLHAALFKIQPAKAQSLGFTLAHDTPVTIEGQPLANPWAGGFNAAQFQTIDLDGDELLDLVVFDRSARRILTFLQKNGAYRHAPSFASLFPEDITFWMVLADYDCDGQKDLFWGTSALINLLRNEANPGEPLRWADTPQSLRTLGFSGQEVNLRVDVTDIPAITDVDNDGDLDLLTFLPSLGGTIDFHQNQAVEQLGRCDTLVFEKVDGRWGGFEECGTCNTYLFEGGNSCDNQRITHAGSALLVADLDGDEDKDVVIGEVSCTNLVQMTNLGNPETADFQTADFTFPASLPVDIFIFPAPFSEDVDFDGQPDLLVSPNVVPQEGEWVDFAQSAWFYKGGEGLLSPEFQSKSFLQDQMIDVGEDARPALLDADGDGDLDLLIGTKGQIWEDGSYQGAIWYFENTGSDTEPSYQLATKDFLGFRSLDEIDFFPQTTDMEGNGTVDLVLTSRARNSSTVNIRIFSSLGAGQGFADPELLTADFSLRPVDKPYFNDLDNDGDQDVLVARFGGEIDFFEASPTGYTLAVEDVGGIAQDLFRREPAISIADYDQDGQDDLLIGDNSGELRFFSRISDLLDGKVASAVDWQLLSEDGQVFDFALGRALFPLRITNGFLLGTGGGGLHFFQTTDPVSSLPDETGKRQKLSVYPNPANEWLSIKSPTSGQFLVFDALGRMISSPIYISAEQEEKLDISQWQKGIYYLRLMTNDGIEFSRFLVE